MVPDKSSFSHCFYLFFKKCIYLVLAVLSLRCCTDLSLIAESGDYSPVVVHMVLIMVAVFGCRMRALGLLGSVAAAPGLYSTDSVVVVPGLIWSAACGIYPDQGLNPCLLHW